MGLIEQESDGRFTIRFMFYILYIYCELFHILYQVKFICVVYALLFNHNMVYIVLIGSSETTSICK